MKIKKLKEILSMYDDDLDVVTPEGKILHSHGLNKGELVLLFYKKK